MPGRQPMPPRALAPSAEREGARRSRRCSVACAASAGFQFGLFQRAVVGQVVVIVVAAAAAAAAVVVVVVVPASELAAAQPTTR
jgi:hypothetical protein